MDICAVNKCFTHTWPGIYVVYVHVMYRYFPTYAELIQVGHHDICLRIQCSLQKQSSIIQYEYVIPD
jgi:hypothetical protein